MKTIITILFLIIQTGVLSGQNSCFEDFDIIDSIYYLDGTIFSGTYTCHDDNGVLRRRGYIVSGKLEGISEFFNSSGKLKETIQYRENQPVVRTFFRSNSNPAYKQSTLNGIEHGVWEKYYMNGQIKERLLFDNGKPIGICGEWDRKGRIVMETDYTKDTIITKYHDYRFGKHTMLVRYIDSCTHKTIKKEKKVVAKSPDISNK